MDTPRWIRKALEQRAISFEELHHPEAYTAQEVAQKEHTSGHRVAKVVAVLVDGHAVELILPATRQVDLGRLRKALHARRARLATESEMQQVFPDCAPGAVPPLRHWKNVDVVMDPSMKRDGDIVFQAGTHTDAVRLNFQDWFQMVKPQVLEFSEVPRATPT